MVTIKNRNYFFFLFMLLFLTCEDKKKERNDFGSISINIIFENQVADSPVNDSESDLVIEDSEVIKDSLKQFLKEGKQKTEDEKLAVEENENKDDLVALKKEKTSLFSSVKYVKITVGGLQPVEINVSGSTASTTIDDIPAGPQSVSVQLLNNDKVILYQETKTVTIVAGETASPSFNNFKVSNESLEVLKPNGGESYEPGNNMSIEWVGSHENIPVDIDLYINNAKTRTIQSSTVNDGNHTWNVPASLSPSTTYQIKITSTNSSSVSDFSDNYFSVVDVVAPAVPSGLSATAGDKQVVLTWSANSESDLKSYKVYGGTSANPTTSLSTVNAGTETYTHTGLTNGTKYYYRISAVDNSGNESSKTSDVNATPVLLGGGNALSFDGTDDYVDVSYTSGQIESEISISAWVNLPSNSDGGHIIFNGCCGTDASWYWGMILENSQSGGGIQPKIMLHTDQGINGAGHIPSSGTGIVTPNTGWHHVAMTYSSNTLKIYLDGSAVHTATVQGSDVTESNQVNIGGWENADGTFNGSMNGKIDEIAIWNDGLTQAEVTALYNSGTALDARTNAGDYSSTDNLKGYWKMEDGSGTTLTDVSGYGNDGTVDGASWATGVLSTSYDNTPKVITGGEAGTYSLSFDGVDDYATTTDPSSTLFTNGASHTLELWYKTSTTHSEEVEIIGNYDRSASGGDTDGITSLYLANTGKVLFRAVGADQITSTTTISDGKWHHIACVYDLDNMKNYLFIDGAKEAEGAISSPTNFGNANNEFHVSGGFSRLSAGVTRYNAGIVNVVRVSDVPRYTASFTPALSFSSDNNTKALWNMSEGSGTAVADASGNGYYLAISGASWVTDVPTGTTPSGGGNALSFDGSNTHVDLPEISSDFGAENSSYTASLWFKDKKSDENSVLISATDLSASQDIRWFSRIGLRHSDNKIDFYGHGIQKFSELAYDEDKWNHVAVTIGNGTVKFYINGVEDQAASYNYENSSNYYSSQRKWQIGNLLAYNNPSGHAFKGEIDEIGLWSKVLTQSEISALYNSGTALDARTNSGDYISTDNLKGYWKMEDGSGSTLTDVSGYANDGTINGASWATGVLSTSYDNTPKTISSSGGGNALSFDGNDKVKLAGIASSDATGSLSLWVYPTDIYIENIVYQSTGTDLLLVLSGNKGICFGINTSSSRKELCQSVDFSDYINKWNHIIGVYDGSNMIIYVNGSSIGTTTHTGNVSLSSSDDLLFGLNAFNNTDGLNGFLDEVGYWNDALSASEVTALYNSGTALDARTNSGDYASTANLLGYWKMEDGSGTTLTDVSGYGNDGTIDGASWTTGVLSTSYDNTPKTIDSEAPVTPTGLKATPTSDGEVKLTWSTNSENDLASYKVYGGTTASPTTLLSTVSSGTETYTQTSLSRGETYYYRISALDNSGNESDKTSDVASGLVSHVTLDHSVSEYDGRVGLSGAGEWQSMSRWVTSDYTSQGIGSNNNLYLKKITFYAGDDVDSTTYKLLAWKGSLGSSPVITDTVSPTASALNTITLSSPVQLDASNPIMFGMSYNQLHDGQYPGGRDTGPAVQNGDLISTDAGGSWVSMSSEYSLDYNWILSGQLIDNDDVFIESLTVDFTKETNVESSTLTSGQSYYLRITGSYGVADGILHADAGYSWRSNADGEPYQAWDWDGKKQRSSPDTYNIHHVYYYYFTGDGTTEKFSFSDGGGYGDNKGSLKIEIWENK